MTKQEIFFKFIDDNFPDRKEELKARFQLYYDILIDANSKINLFSRKMPHEDIWITHFLDSCLPYSHIKKNDARILDFGTGGGLPGIPIAILYPQVHVNLLDSKRKKILVLNEMIEILELDNVDTIWSRLEDYRTINLYDYIICRSVKIIPELKAPLMQLLDKKGTMLLYKSKVLDDVTQFKNYKITDYSNENLGTRKVIEVKHD